MSTIVKFFIFFAIWMSSIQVKADKFKEFNESLSDDIIYKSPENRYGNYKGPPAKGSNRRGRQPASVPTPEAPLKNLEKERNGERKYRRDNLGLPDW